MGVRQSTIKFDDVIKAFGEMNRVDDGRWESRCPKCKAKLRVDRMNSGLQYLCHGGCSERTLCATVGISDTSIVDFAGLISGASNKGVVVCMASVVTERVNWLYARRVPLGKVTVIDGDPGQGKSTIACDLAARLSRGCPMPGIDEALAPANVLILSAEDGMADTIKPRLEAAGADMNRIFALPMEVPITLPKDIDLLEAWVMEKQVKLVTIDVLMAFIGVDTNAYKDADIRRVMSALAGMAEKTGCAVIVLRHFNKASGASAIYRGGGSIGIAGAARSVLVVGRDPNDPSRCIFAQAKNNLSPLAESLAYRLVDTGNGSAKVQWEGFVDVNADSLVNQPIQASGEQSALDVAERFLIEYIGAGSRETRELDREADIAGIRRATLRRAKERMNLKPFKLGYGAEGKWMIALPEELRPAEHPADENEVEVVI